ncbi:MAG: DNA-formamidopyrimidine glycosylase family protein [Nitriliruptorales bacterium]|nr:DNA-formamidopyrimidine glycosylase family protein [Nitriliruptorales bacterium]
MPEGDTIHRAARTLRHALVGEHVVDVAAPRLASAVPAPGTRIDAVEARGKHLLVHFDDGHILHTHLGMPGSWHVYPRGGTARRRDLRVRIDVEDVTAVCFGAPTVEMLDAPALARHPQLSSLGPDLCRDDADLDAAVRRMPAFAAPTTPVGVVLLDQRVAAGIGNVYRSEVCFLEGIDPRSPLAVVSDEQRKRLLARASTLLRKNLHTVRRTTVPGREDGALFVYGRGGRACRRCRTRIESEHLGEHARIAYWCPTCQPPPA